MENCSPNEQRVRRIAVHFYLVDNTLDVCEPKQDDSGILQVGKLSIAYTVDVCDPRRFAAASCRWTLLHCVHSSWQLSM